MRTMIRDPYDSRALVFSLPTTPPPHDGKCVFEVAGKPADRCPLLHLDSADLSRQRREFLLIIESFCRMAVTSGRERVSCESSDDHLLQQKQKLWLFCSLGA